MARGNAIELQALLPTSEGDGNVSPEAIRVLDGQETLYLRELGTLTEYLGAYPEAENDRATRLFHYTSRCSLELLVALFDKYQPWNLKMVPRGPMLKQPPSGFRSARCTCPACSGGRPCGISGLEFSIALWQFDNAADDRDHRLEVSGSNETFSVFAGGQKATFRLRPWSVQLFQFPTRRVEHIDTALDALLYYDDFTDAVCANVPLEYVLSVTQTSVSNWAIIIEKSQRFLGFYEVEALSPRLETDRSIIRHLLGAAQLWKSLLSMIQAQISHLGPICDMKPDDPWLRGARDPEQVLEVAKSSLQMLRIYEASIQQNLLKEADQLIQQMTNLITIDEGYRSRDMNTSIWRLSWVTFIFLPLVFASTVFGMNVDVFRDNPAWWYYFVFSVPLIVLVVALYLGFRSSSSVAAWFKRNPSQVADAGSGDFESLVGVNTVLRWAAATGQIDTIAGLLGAEGYPTASSQEIGLGGASALISSIMTGNEPIMSLLVQRNPQAVNETDAQGAAALHHAAGEGRQVMVAFLLNHGATIHQKDSRGLTALDWAITNGDDGCTAEILQKMHGKNGHVNSEALQGLTSIHITCVYHDIAMLKRLIAAGYNKMLKDAKGRIPPFSALEQGFHEFFIQVASLYGDNDLRDTDYLGLGLLHAAVQQGDLDTVKYLLGRGLDANLKAANSLKTPLHVITRAPDGTDRLAIVEHLCANGASRSAQNSAGSTIAHLIAHEGRPDSPGLLQHLIQSERWRLKVQDTAGRTPVHIAAMSGHLATVKQLLSLANLATTEILAIKDRDGLFPVDLAARAGHLDIFELLRPHPDSVGSVAGRQKFDTLVRELVRKDDIAGLQKAFGFTEAENQQLEHSSKVFKEAVAAGATQTITFILGKVPGWMNSRYGRYNGTVLTNAIASGNQDLVDFLLDADAPVEGQDDSGWNPLHVAAFWGLRPSTTTRIVSKMGDKYEKDKCGWIPYDLAYFYYRTELYDMLAPMPLSGHRLPWARKMESQPETAGGQRLRGLSILPVRTDTGSVARQLNTSGDVTQLAELPC